MNINYLVINLVCDYPTKENEIRQITGIVDELEKGENVKENVGRLQDICNTLFEITTTEHLIELQVLINEYRYEYDVTDPTEVINQSDDGNFVQ